jgi:outer membrane protein
MIKKTLFALSLVVLFTTLGTSQRIAIVDINAVLDGMPEYKEAQTNLDKVAAEWRQEIAQEYDKIKSMYNKYQAEQVLLSDEVRQQREDEIVGKEGEVRDLQKRRFGPEGDLFRKREELVSPIQDQVYNAIEGYAADRGYDLIFDKSGSAGLLFASEEYDKTQDIIKKVR